MDKPPNVRCCDCRHCNQETYFPKCLVSSVPAHYEPVYGVNTNPRRYLCLDENESGDCQSFEPIPEPYDLTDRILRWLGCHPWVWGRE